MHHEAECPLCGESATDKRVIVSHMMTHHRKSSISRMLLDAAE